MGSATRTGGTMRRDPSPAASVTDGVIM